VQAVTDSRSTHPSQRPSSVVSWPTSDKRHFEQFYGIRYTSCCDIFVELFVAGVDFETQNLVLRRIYPFILGVVVFVAFCIFQARQFRRLYEHIKNDKYVGLVLVSLRPQLLHCLVCLSVCHARAPCESRWTE